MGTHYEGSTDEQRTLDAFIKLMRATETVNQRLNRHLADHNLTVSQFGVMEALLHLGPLNQSALANKLLKSGGNITMVIDNLEKANWVRRKPDPQDGRSMLVQLTTDGKTYIKNFFPVHLAKIKEEFSVLTKDEKLQLAKICKKLGTREEESNQQ